MTDAEVVPNTPYGLLLPHHHTLLAESAITARVAKARGYRSLTHRPELERLGFSPAQRLVPALLVPVWNVFKKIATYQLRPDVPRTRDGKFVKYETLAGTRMVLDVPPMAQQWLGDPTRPLFVTEGARKADAGVSKGLCCIALLGVWNWRGTNEHGGKVALADWDSIALNQRDVSIAFDSDVMQKSAVHAALTRLKAYLENRGAKVQIVYLPPGPGNEKVGLDDYLAAGHSIRDLRALAVSELHPLPDGGDTKAPLYEATADGLLWLKPTKDGRVSTPLTNFTAEIISDITEDDSAEVRHIFEIEARRENRRDHLRISAERFASMHWTADLGARAIVYPGFGLADHTRAAIQFLSHNVAETRVYTHTGWRKVEGAWAYLHAGGAIGPHGPLAGVHVRLPDVLARFSLPAPPRGDDLVNAVRASLRLLEVGKARITFPLYAAMARATMATADFSVHVAGETGSGKTAVSSLLQQHYGSGMSPDHLPASWSSTANALEGLAFQAKDALLLVDDFAPSGSQYDIQRLHREADRVLRGQGNNSGRQRMRPDGTLRPPKPPRGLILSTGEDAPRGQSLRARVLVVELSGSDLDWGRLTACQSDAEDGLYAQALAGFVQYLAHRYEQVQNDLRSEMIARRRAASGTTIHRRIPTTIAHLQVGLNYWLQYAQDAAKNIWERGVVALNEAADAQVQHQDSTEPTQRFRELLAALIASGAAHVAATGGEAPKDPEAWGWRLVTVGAGDSERTEDPSSSSDQNGSNTRV